MSKSIVVSDGVKKYRLVMEGDLETVTMGKLKRYLSKSTGAEPSRIILKFENKTLSDTATGAEVMLYDGAVLSMEVLSHSTSVTPTLSSRSQQHQDALKIPHTTTAQAPSISNQSNASRTVSDQFGQATQSRLASDRRINLSRTASPAEPVRHSNYHHPVPYSGPTEEILSPHPVPQQLQHRPQMTSHRSEDHIPVGESSRLIDPHVEAFRLLHQITKTAADETAVGESQPYLNLNGPAGRNAPNRIATPSTQATPLVGINMHQRDGPAAGYQPPSRGSSTQSHPPPATTPVQQNSSIYSQNRQSTAQTVTPNKGPTEREKFLIAEREALEARDREREEWLANEREILDGEYRKLREERTRIAAERSTLAAERNHLLKRTRELDEREDLLLLKEEHVKREEAIVIPSRQQDEESIAQLHSQLARLQQSQIDLQQDLARTKRERDEDFDRLLREHEDELELVKRSAARNDGEIQRLQEIANSKSDRLEAAREDLVYERRNAAKLAEQLSLQTAENTSLKAEMDDFKERIQNLESMLKVQKGKNLKLLQQLNAATEEAHKSDAALVLASDKLVQNETKMEQATVRATTAEETLNLMRSKLMRTESACEALQASLHKIKAENAALQSSKNISPPRKAEINKPKLEGKALLDALLRHFSETMRVGPLALDENLTCVVPLDGGFTVLVTHDPTTERLFLYSTLLSQIPFQESVRLQLYEALLEGSLLGREMAGGGVGISKANGLIILSTCIPLQTCDEFSLAVIAAPFVEAVRRWVLKAEEIAGIPQSQSLIRERSAPLPSQPQSAIADSERTSPQPSRFLEKNVTNDTGLRNNTPFSNLHTSSNHHQPQYDLSASRDRPRRSASFAEAF